jgi:hypothetical protein
LQRLGWGRVRDVRLAADCALLGVVGRGIGSVVVSVAVSVAAVGSDGGHSSQAPTRFLRPSPSARPVDVPRVRNRSGGRDSSLLVFLPATTLRSWFSDDLANAGFITRIFSDLEVSFG